MIKKLLIGLLIIALLFFSYSYYEEYRKKESYKAALVKDFASSYRTIELREFKMAEETIEELSSIQPPAFLSTKEDSIPIYAELLNSFSLKLKTNMHYKNLNGNTNAMDSVKLSGILSELNKDELETVSKAYTQAEKLKEIRQELQEVSHIQFYDIDNNIPSTDEIKATHEKYYVLLLKEQNILGDFSLACKAAVLELEKNNVSIKETDSLKIISKK